MRICISILLLGALGACDRSLPRTPNPPPAPSVVARPSAEAPEPVASATPDAAATEPEPEPPVSPEPVLWVTGEELMNHVAVDDRSVYWGVMTMTPEPGGGARGSGGEIYAKDKRDDTVREVWRGPLIPWDLLVTGKTLVFSQQVRGAKRGALIAVPTRGGDALTLASQIDGPAAFTADASSAYYVDQMRVLHSVSLDGGSDQVLFTSTKHIDDDMGFDGANLYFIQDGNEISALPKSGGTVRKIASVSNVRSIVVQSGFVYFSDPGTKTVARVSTSGGKVETLARDKRIPGDLAVDADSVYWATAAPEFNALLRVPKAGGAVVTIMHGELNFGGLVVDHNYLFTVRFGDRVGILRVGKHRAE
jgi:hypothetical protein